VVAGRLGVRRPAARAGRTAISPSLGATHAGRGRGGAKPGVGDCQQAPSFDRHAAERAIEVIIGPATDRHKFEWLDNNVVPGSMTSRPAHSTVALSVGGVPTEFKTGASRLGV